jgi:hypothetical protein
MDDLIPIFLRVRREDIAYIKFVIESYEGIGIVRTLDRHAAIIVVLSTGDFAATVRAVVASIGARLPCAEIDRPAEAQEDWLLRAEDDGPDAG